MMQNIPQYFVAEAKTLQNYAKAVVHLRTRFQEGNLGLLFGAGISKSFGLPLWPALIERLAKHLNYTEYYSKIRDKPLPTISKLLLTRFAFLKKKDFEKNKNFDTIIQGLWYAKLRDALYNDFPDTSEFYEKHPYINEFLEIILKSPLTISFNFDSCIEMMLSGWQRNNKIPEKLYEAIDNGAVPFRGQKRGIIYHINGYIPRNPLESLGNKIVFSSDEFYKQKDEKIDGLYSTFEHCLSKYTYILLGLSLRDENFKSFLKQHAKNNPGHYHYYIKRITNLNTNHDDGYQAFREKLFDEYNLICLQLNDAEIAALARLIRYDYCGYFRNFAAMSGINTTWVYYLTGIPGSGKTTIARHMQSLRTYDEWLEEVLPLLKLPHTSLSPEVEYQADCWIANQFAQKNMKLLSEKEGIFLVDRAPLDPLSYRKQNEKISIKAKWYHEHLYQGDVNRDIKNGEILLLEGNIPDIASRIIYRTGNDSMNTNHLQELSKDLHSLYADKKVRIIKTNDLSIKEVVKKISKIIYLDGDYREVNIARLLETIKQS
mgnify:CR=1 FL=1